MENKIISYLRDNPSSSIHQIASYIGESDLDVYRTVSELQKAEWIGLDPKQLGNSHDPDNSALYRVLYRTIGKRDAFDKITKPFELVEFLSDYNYRLANSKYLHHYTRVSRVMQIISERKMALSNPKDMNDILEYEKGDMESWKGIFFSCFMMEDRESIAMWSMYSQPWDVGIKISIPKEVAVKWIESTSSLIGFRESDKSHHNIDNFDIGIKSVAYHNLDTEDSKYGLLRWNTVSNKNFKTSTYPASWTGYIKDNAWAYEKEVRLFVSLINDKNLDRILIDVPEYVVNSMILTSSPKFDGKVKDVLGQDVCTRVAGVHDSYLRRKLRIVSACDTCDYALRSRTLPT